MSQEKCFCGERVGVLVQGNRIPEDEKDAKDQQALFYSVGEVIQIGLNQATYLAAEDRIKSDDNFTSELLQEKELDILANPTEEQIREIENFVKSYVKNRGIRVYPNNPVFVDRMRNLLPEDLLEPVPAGEGEICDCSKRDSFCLYHVMLKTLRYTNEIVVDISNNCLQSLFWLGAAHGLDTYAITVLHEKTDKEREAVTEVEQREQRYIFDVAGLWTAIFRKHDTEGFYQQLASVQRGIEKHSKLMIPNSQFYRKNIQECLFSGKTDLDEAYLQQWFEKKKENNGINLEIPDLDENHPICLYKKKKEEEKLELESYYRNRFWAPMLNYNRLRMYISQENTMKDLEPKLWTAKWDFDAVSRLSHYLSKRTVIGEYSLRALPNKQEDPEAGKINFVSIGSYAQPIRNLPDGNLARYINDRITASGFFKSEQEERYLYNVVHERYPISGSDREFQCEKTDGESGCSKRMIKGFMRIGSEEEGFFTQQPQVRNCVQCGFEPEHSELEVFYEINKAESSECHIKINANHYEIAQLILWREDGKSQKEHSHFWVELIGCSGPATSALSSLFVDEQQRKECFGKEVGNLLCELQLMVRKRVMEVFLNELNEKLNELINENGTESSRRNNKGRDEKQKKRYISLIKYTIASYLDTVLYRYFFPFLSKKDINRIYNGMYNFVNTMKAAKTSPFVLDYPQNGDKDYDTSIPRDTVQKVIKLIPEILRTVLQGFRGLEAFYLVEVGHQLDKNEDSPEDTRKIRNIEMMKRGEDGQENIICFFI